MEINADEDGFHYMEMLNVNSKSWYNFEWLARVKIESKKASKDQAEVKGKRCLGCRKTMAVAKEESIAFSLVTNQAKRSYIMRRIKSLLDHMKKVI
jgi:hypothetical protein